MERLDQGHLHPKLEIPRLTCLGRDRTRAWEASAEHSNKELLEQRG